MSGACKIQAGKYAAGTVLDGICLCGVMSVPSLPYAVSKICAIRLREIEPL